MPKINNLGRIKEAIRLCGETNDELKQGEPITLASLALAISKLNNAVLKLLEIEVDRA